MDPISETQFVVEPPDVWESEIAIYERRDKRRPPVLGATVFVGSSTIRMWKTLSRDMAPLAVLNRGFGGAQMDAVLHYAPRIVLPYEPRAVVLYAGENDLESIRGKTPERVMEDVQDFSGLLTDTFPTIRLYVLSQKPSPARVDVWKNVRRYNELLEDLCGQESSREFVDVTTVMWDLQGRTRMDLFLEDGIHLSDRGYEVWTEIVAPILQSDPTLLVSQDV